MANGESLPAVFAPGQESDKFLAGVKKRAGAKFSWKKQESLDNGSRLAYWLFVFRKEEQALEVCRFLGAYEFAGNFNLWSWIELALALQSRLARQGGRADESAECVRRIGAAGFVVSRLEGSLLSDKLECIQRAAEEKNKTGEREWCLVALRELCILIELGGSAPWPVAALEHEFERALNRLRVLLKVS